MKQFVQHLLKWLYRLEDLLVVVLLASMMGLAVMQIVLRNGFDSGIQWAGPLLRVLVFWIALVGAVIASRERQHISSDLLSRFLPVTIRRFSGLVTGWATAIICAMLAWYSFQFVQMEYESPTMAFANIPTWVCESIMPVAFVVIALRYLAHGWLSLSQPVRDESL